MKKTARAREKIAVVIPCYRVKAYILGVIAAIGPEVDAVFVVDDACPEGSGRHVAEQCSDSRVKVLYHDANKGVGGAMKTGYRAALEAGCDIVVKVDGDGQMDPSLLPRFVRPIEARRADYVKGNRFFSFERVRAMPRVRLIGNAILSFMTKLSSGYWSVFDPTNGYTAIHRVALERLRLDKISDRYFFESDMLIHLGQIGAVIREVEMAALYRDATSSLRIRAVVGEFLWKNARAVGTRLIYWYFLRDFSIASVNLVAGVAFLAFGTVFGAVAWYRSFASGVPATAGTVMLAGVPVVLGMQLLLSFVSLDIGNEPRIPLVERTADELGSSEGAP